MTKLVASKAKSQGAQQPMSAAQASCACRFGEVPHLALRQAVGAQDARQLDLVLDGAVLVKVPKEPIPANPMHTLLQCCNTQGQWLSDVHQTCDFAA